VPTVRPAPRFRVKGRFRAKPHCTSSGPAARVHPRKSVAPGARAVNLPRPVTWMASSPTLCRSDDHADASGIFVDEPGAGRTPGCGVPAARPASSPGADVQKTRRGRPATPCRQWPACSLGGSPSTFASGVRTVEPENVPRLVTNLHGRSFAGTNRQARRVCRSPAVGRNH